MTADDSRRRVPRTDAVLADPRVAEATDRLGRPLVRRAVAEVLDAVRSGAITVDGVIDAVLDCLPASAITSRHVINATGVIIHTGLGRAPLSHPARDALAIASGYTDVEHDLATGRRSTRGAGAIAALYARIPAAEAVHIVNNNAAALALVAALANGREIVISRGELIEIGDRFRLPDLLEAAGARLREVGTTNRTHLDDYADAVTDNTAFILKVHPSNFVQTGFVADVGVSELAKVGPPVVHDIGSGLLAPDPRLPGEPDAETSLRAGSALITASGDKLLGGPQAGIICGNKDLVESIRRHPLARAMRVGKTTLAALEATFVGGRTPVESALGVSVAELRRRVRVIVTDVRRAGIDAELAETSARVGGGAAPHIELPSAAVSIASGFDAALRTSDPAIVGRREGDRLLLDLRAVPADDDQSIIAAIRREG